MQGLLFISTRNNLRVLENGILIFHADVKNIVIRESKKKKDSASVFFSLTGVQIAFISDTY